MMMNKTVWMAFALFSALLFLSPLTATAQEQQQQNQSVEYEMDWKIPNDEKYDPLDGAVVKVGDVLNFVWSGSHNVLLHPSGSCDDAGAVYLGASSPLRYEVESEGLHTFACDVGGGVHCQVGQIFNVTVVAADNDVADSDSGSSGSNPTDKDAENEEEEEDDKTSKGGKDSNQEDEDKDVLDRYQQYFNP